jgi:hypothetical protein
MHCCKVGNMPVCKRCELVRSVECQREGWAQHKAECKMWRQHRSNLGARASEQQLASQRYQLWGPSFMSMLHVRTQLSGTRV